MNYEKNYYKLESNSKIFNSIKDEKNTVGYYELPNIDVSKIIEFSKKVSQKYIAVIGIGGSSLGSLAIFKFLKLKKKFSKNLKVFDSTDPVDINNKLNSMELDNTFFIVISKSGTTIETISIFKYVASLVEINTNNCAIVSELDSKLNKYAERNNLPFFEIPKNVGGRFSVFSTAGLLPLSIIGIDIKKLLNGAKKVNKSFFRKENFYDVIMQKARFLVENKNKYNITVLFSYSSSLAGFNSWFVQLWGESLGKMRFDGVRQGLTPISLLGPSDQHSFLQLLMEGKRDKTIMFIKVDDFEEKTTIPDNTLKGFEDIEYVDNLKFEDLIHFQADSIIKSINDLEDIPYDVLTIDKVDENSIAMLMQSFMILTSIVGRLLRIDTYTQPGVESGKKILKNKLEK